jgi:hypothetical protein
MTTRQQLSALEEFRFEAGSSPVTVTVRPIDVCVLLLVAIFNGCLYVQLVVGKAEVFGSEMALQHAYTFVETQQDPK